MHATGMVQCEIAVLAGLSLREVQRICPFTRRMVRAFR
jgi:hypothetical protein